MPRWPRSQKAPKPLARRKIGGRRCGSPTIRMQLHVGPGWANQPCDSGKHARSMRPKHALSRRIQACVRISPSVAGLSQSRYPTGTAVARGGHEIWICFADLWLVGLLGRTGGTTERDMLQASLASDIWLLVFRSEVFPEPQALPTMPRQATQLSWGDVGTGASKCAGITRSKSSRMREIGTVATHCFASLTSSNPAYGWFCMGD